MWAVVTRERHPLLSEGVALLILLVPLKLLLTLAELHKKKEAGATMATALEK